MKDYKDLEFLVERANIILSRQVESFRTNNTKASTIIGINSIIIPIFLFIIEKAHGLTQILSIIPVALFLFSNILMIHILWIRNLDQGFNPTELDRLVNEKYEKVLLFEIGVIKNSIIDNQKITGIQNRTFNKGLIITEIAIILSVLLLIMNLILNKI